MRHGIEGIAFDLDGTLYPNYRLNIKLIPFVLREGRLLAAFGKTRTIIRREQKNGSPTQASFYDYQAEITAKLLNVEAQPLKEKIERLIYKDWELLFKKIKLFKHVNETLDALKKMGLKMGLLSDFPPQTKLEYLGISGGWDAVLCSEQCGALKPHPISFTKLAANMGLPPEKILYVGNSYSYDVKGAASVGMRTAWIKNPLVLGCCKNKPKPDFSFNNYRQLYNYMVD
ncbi:MAG: HAD family hydrolase [Treponema sp.]|jgi:putative hydrolase of the HAD superfamily|nr:HAD family hydrolase [Treponema sp.]